MALSVPRGTFRQRLAAWIGGPPELATDWTRVAFAAGWTPPKQSLRERIAQWIAGRAFEGAQASPQHASRPANSLQSPDSAIDQAGYNLRAWGRYLDENHDLAIGILDDLVTNIVGTGIDIEPMPMTAGRQNQELADRILELWDSWGERCEVTGETPWGELQRLACRAWLRDGEFFAQHVGADSTYPFDDGAVRYRLEFLESDMVPLDTLGATDTRARQGIIHDTWGRPLAYLVYLDNPYDYGFSGNFAGVTFETKTVPVERMLHVKFVRRLPQTRGMPICHGIIRRLQDLKDYEDSERIAARVAASMCAFIRKSPDAVVPQDVAGNLSGERQRKFQAGQVFDDLLPGEDVGVIDTNRPNSELTNYRAAQTRALSAGTGAKHSAISRTFDSSYSAMRQELVDAKPHYDRLRNYFVARFVRPVYERWLRTAWLQGLLGVPAREAFDDLKRAEYIGPGMPWIDPLKEVQADVMAIENRLAARTQIIRGRGHDPRKVDALSEEDETQPSLEVVEDEDDENAESEESAI